MGKNLYLEAMEDFKESVKRWLKDNGRDRFWLAKQLFVEKGTVDDWMKKAGVIPPAKAELIKKLMEPSSPDVTGECKGALDLVLKLDAETYGQFAAWAAQSGFEPTADGIAKWAVQVAHTAGVQSSRSPRKTRNTD